ncbi:MAG TPA: hypothetical protein VFU21_13545 [Kofleriaceae bacterium]|nr:hypothetical protein [Kofleriaceae bacterium]
MAQRTFRDFAGAVMAGKMEEAGVVLGELLALDDDEAARATAQFDAGMRTGGPEFMAKAMALRTAVGARDQTHIRGILADCFGLAGGSLDGAVSALLRR